MTLNKVLWCCLIIPPSIALGILAGSFPNTTYTACLAIFAGTLLLAVVHSLLLKKWPTSPYTSHFILVSLDLLLVFMNCSRINIHITWFFVPLLSILFCDMNIYLIATIFNYIFLVLSEYITAPYHASMHSGFTTPRAYFINSFGGYTIETMIMAIAGIVISKYLTRYLKRIHDENVTIKYHQMMMEDNIRIQESMARIYDTVNLIDFDRMIEKPLSERESAEYSIEGHAHSKMNHTIRKKVIPDQYEAFSEFTDITTIRRRLIGKKSLSAEFINTETGWFRAQYISLEDDKYILPHKIIYTTQSIDEVKKKEEYLIHISTTDELTGLYNRRSYDRDIEKYKTQDIEDDLVLFSIDINGLKQANDTLGHSAGDELIKAAADCILWSVCNIGKVYRTGGDEFLTVVNTYAPEEITESIRRNARNWRGRLNETLSLSIGYGAHMYNRTATISDLEKIADEKMYEDKSLYYKSSGKDRRIR